MTARNVVLAIDTTTIPEVGRLLAIRGIHLGPVTAQTGKLRCFRAELDGVPGLTDDQLAMVRLMAEGLKMAAVARRLGVSYDHARTLAKKLYRVLGANGRTESVAIAYRMGALDTWKATA